jgi:hypothetical protein
MSTQAAVPETASIQQQCKVLRLPAIAAQCGHLAEQAVRERRSRLGFLEALLQAELEVNSGCGGAAHSRSASAADEDPEGEASGSKSGQ